MDRFTTRLAALGLAALAALAGDAQAQVVISQVYGGGGNTGAPYKNDYIELHNTGSSTVDVTGWSVQYASSGGNSWTNKTLLTGAIAPGGYYLVRQGAGAGNGADLPAAQVDGTIAMSATAGKVALVGNSTTLPAVTCPTGGAIIDFVGYGGANCSETAPTPALSNTLAALRKDDGCTDTGNNAADFATGAPAPRNAASPARTCGVVTPTLLSIADAQEIGRAHV